MSRVSIETITPIHIGSGNILQYNTDFITDKSGDDSFLYVIDPDKIFYLIGFERLNDWILSIKRNEDVKSFVKRYVKNAIPEDYSKRVITNYATIQSNDTLKECIHNGMGVPYIPGSSIKGAIRTAVLSTLVKKIDDVDRKIKNKQGRISAKLIENELFGNDPKSDLFRFIQVGDAYFEKECEIATTMEILNIQRKTKNLIDKSKRQVVEAIASNCNSFFQMKIASDYHQKSKLPLEIKDLSSLFLLMNIHTKSLVKDEIEYWEKLNNEEYSGADNYIKEMKQVLNTIESCQKGKDCVLRIGYASGWRFITGAWTEHLRTFEENVIPASRPQNKRFYEDYDFPKSRKLDDEGYVFGFVKLSIV